MKLRWLIVPPVLAGALALGGCATMPSGPSVMVLPGSGKNFSQFRSDDYMCRQYARDQLGGMTPEQAAADSGVRSAVVGTAVGAAAGALIDGSHGAGVGAGAGLLMGGLAGSGAAQGSAYGAQRRYDNAYVQCMYAEGHRVPVAGERRYDSPRGYDYPPPRRYDDYPPPRRRDVPPPPPGEPPGPPPDYYSPR